MRRYYLVECIEHKNGDVESRIFGEFIVSGEKSARVIQDAMNEFAKMEGKRNYCYFYVSDDKIKRIM